MKRPFASWLGSVGIAFVLSAAMGSVINAGDRSNSAQPSSSVGGSSSPDARPDWCKKGWECLPTEEVADATREIIDLREQLLRARGRRLGWTLGPSIGVGAVVTDQYDVKWVPNVGFSLTWGWRSR